MSREAWGDPPDSEPQYCPMCGEKTHTEGCEVCELDKRRIAAEGEANSLRAQVAARDATIAELRANGPEMRRGTRGDGSVWMGTMRDVLNDYKRAAEAEARIADDLRTQLAKAKEIADETFAALEQSTDEREQLSTQLAAMTAGKIARGEEPDHG